ncbi:unnamed protein product, partial [Brugia pahangi]|uniref:Uncharacterized protein n=1 Tax=Brugia pahangi TaxID=6280 RepID=A0A0N4TAQ6_BRUPA
MNLLIHFFSVILLYIQRNPYGNAQIQKNPIDAQAVQQVLPPQHMQPQAPVQLQTAAQAQQQK